MGDGAMAQFNSALDAVRCAVEIQQNASEQLEASLRIGIHLGDITIDNDELYGDGVNVASRIESIAEPGSIYISEAVQGAIKGSDIQTAFRGERKLKNVDRPIRIYQVVDQAESISRALVPRKSLLPWLVAAVLIAVFLVWKLKDSPEAVQGKTIAVLPLKLQNADSTNKHLVPGITAELVRSIGKLRELTVINPISTMRFMASMAPVQQASAELQQSDLFLAGTLEEKNGQLKLDLGLYNREQQELWSKDYQGDIYELPQLAGTIAIDLAEFIRINLSESESSRIVNIEPVDPETFRLMLLGKNHLAKFTPQDIAIGLNYLRQAVDKNPTSSRAWSNLAEGLIMMGHSPAPPPGVWEEARASATRALQLDPLNAEAWAWLGTTKTYYHWDYDGAMRCYQKANKLNPSLPMSHYHYAWHLLLFDSLEKAVAEHEVAFKLDPLDPFQSARLGHIYMIAGDMDKALTELRRSQRLQPDFVITKNVLGEYYLNTQQFDSAEYYFKATHVFGKGSLATTYFAWGKPEQAWEIINEMESDIIPYYAFNLALIYAQLGYLDKFFEYANYPQPHAFHPWLIPVAQNPAMIPDPRVRQEIANDPRFDELKEKMNL
jgi:tetratricopeptide (TPR) repeat protein